MKVAVLGAGLIGVATAWWLRQAGYEVCLIDRRPHVAQEGSRYSGALLSVGQARPWAQPGVPWLLLRGLFNKRASLYFQPRLAPRQWLWGAQFLRQCTAQKARTNTLALVRLAEYSRALLQQLSQELSIDYQGQQCGLLTLYRTHQDLDQAEYTLDRLRDLGVERRLLTPQELVALEPSLAHCADNFVGADYTAEDGVGDPFLYTLALAQHLVEQGVSLLTNTSVSRLICRQGLVHSIEVINHQGAYEQLQFDRYVVALGAHSDFLLRQAGLSYPLYPTKGYSATFKMQNAKAAPRFGVYDQQLKLSFVRLGDTLRVAGLAELSDLNPVLNDFRCRLLVEYAQRYFGQAIQAESVQYWAGLRSTTPSNVPVVGQTAIKNLFVNTGHGPLGWTTGVGTSKILADIMMQKRPKLDFPLLL